MSRRFSRITFWFAILVCAPPMAIKALSLSPTRPNIVGAWDGFYLTADDATGSVESNITEVDFPRIAGDGTLFDLGEGVVSFSLRAVMPQPYSINGTGETQTGRLTFHADLQTFAGLGGDAGVMSAQYHFTPSKGGASPVDALLLHPFPGVATPDISGNGQGPFVSLPDPDIPGSVGDPNFTGVGQVQISARNSRGSFAGKLEFSPAPLFKPLFSWPLLGTTSENGRVIMISQGATGRVIYDGVVIPPTPSQPQTFVGGFFRLSFFDGRSIYGAINFNLSTP